MHHNYYEDRMVAEGYYYDNQMHKYEDEAMTQIRHLIKSEYIFKMAPAIALACLNQDGIAEVFDEVLELNAAHCHAILGDRDGFIECFDKEI